MREAAVCGRLNNRQSRELNQCWCKWTIRIFTSTSPAIQLKWAAGLPRLLHSTDACCSPPRECAFDFRCALSMFAVRYWI